MKKSSFVALCMGTVSLILFALGMCMALQPEWQLFDTGVVLGAAGLVFGFMTLLIWRRMEHKEPIHFSMKNVLLVIWTVLGLLVLGIGMCFSMVWGFMLQGAFIGIIGILMLLALFPMVKGIH